MSPLAHKTDERVEAVYFTRNSLVLCKQNFYALDCVKTPGFGDCKTSCIALIQHVLRLSNRGNFHAGPKRRNFVYRALVVDLKGGRSISVPLSWYPRLLKATAKQRSSWEVCGGGYGIHWPDIDEDLSTDGLLRGAPAPLRHSKKTLKARRSSYKRRVKTKARSS